MCPACFDECAEALRRLLLEQALATLLLALRDDECVLGSESSNLAAMHLGLDQA